MWRRRGGKLKGSAVRKVALENRFKMAFIERSQIWLESKKAILIHPESLLQFPFFSYPLK